MSSVRRHWLLSILIATVLVLAAGLQVTSAVIEQEKIYYGIEVSGTLCGYAEFDLSSIEKDGRELILVKEMVFTKQTALGMEFDSKILLIYHVDPETGRFVYHENDIKQGHIEIHNTFQVDGDTVRITVEVQ